MSQLTSEVGVNRRGYMQTPLMRVCIADYMAGRALPQTKNAEQLAPRPFYLADRTFNKEVTGQVPSGFPRGHAIGLSLRGSSRQRSFPQTLPGS